MPRTVKTRTVRTRYVLLLMLLALFVGVNVGGYFAVPSVFGSAAQYAVSTEGYVPVEISIAGSDLVMSGPCETLRVTVSDIQALSIAYGLEKHIDQRPLTHDTMKDIFDNLNIRMLAAHVDYYADGIYYGDIVLQQGNRVLSVDSRPSDAIALAVRYDLPVYFNETLLREHGVSTC